MIITYVIYSVSGSGGMERILCDKSREFVRNGIEVHIIYLNGSHDNMFFEFDSNIIFHSLHLSNNYENIGNYFKRAIYRCKFRKEFYSRLNKVLNEIKGDISISMLYQKDLEIFNRIHDGSKKISELHFSKRITYTENYSSLKRSVRTILAKWRYNKRINEIKKLDRFVVLTNEDYFQWSELSNHIVIPNFINIGQSDDYCANYQSNIVLSVGRIDIQKGYDYLFDAWKIVMKNYPDWRLFIAGEGALFDEFQSKINEFQLSNSIILKGGIKSVAPLYEESSIYVMSSRYEGFGLVLLEAMQHKLPIVSYACKCGPRDLIDHNQTGILVDDVGDIVGLANGLMCLMESVEQRQRMGLAGYEKSKQFDKDVVINKWITLFGELLVKE